MKFVRLPKIITDANASFTKDAPQLVIASFLMLFLELALIKWTGSNIIYLSYFTNFVLLGSFLGIGIGFLRANSKVNLFTLAPIVLTTFVALVLIFPVQINRSGSDLIYFGKFDESGLPVWITLPVIFLLVALMMAMVAEGVARRFVKFKSLDAYRWDIIGSISGIVVFSAVSFADAPPIVWGLIVAAAFLLLLQRKIMTVIVVALVGLLLILGVESLSPNTIWSPYYKITLHRLNGTPSSPVAIDVDGILHQTAETVQQRLLTQPEYFLPYKRLANKTLNNVLVVGAGSGGDVAIALSMGAKHVDAVEIDPQLYQLGKTLNQDHPYQDKRVTVHINDGRAFLDSTKQKYDLILFALPDSLTLVSGQSSLRLESYLFTTQAMQAARDHLNPHGVFAMYNYYRDQWLVDRLGQTMQDAFGTAPCVDSVGTIGKLAVLTDSSDPAAIHCATTWTAPHGGAPAPVSDDRPFLYLKTRFIPLSYVVTLVLILFAALAAVRLVAGPFKQMVRYIDLFFMGSAFFLLETKSIVQFALLFGTTWFVNALVFSGVLVAVYAAVEVARHTRKINQNILWGVLFASLAVGWAISPDSLLSLSVSTRFLAATLVMFTPIFIANLIFAQRFRNVRLSSMAFGANILGAVVGGLLEYTSIIIGYRALGGVVAVLYAAALFTSKRAKKT